jgi:glycyl-tRNA synthetase beta chain
MNFLLEIGVEEIPDWMIPDALEHLRQKCSELLHADLTADATARRLTVRGTGLPEREDDREELVTGPATSAPAGAVAGFAKKLGIAAEQLSSTKTAKGEYWTFQKKTAGRKTVYVLADALPQIISAIPFPKAMYWTGKSGIRFIRPIRWIVALFNDEVIPFSLAGVLSNNETSGHRRLGKPVIPVTFDNYESKLRENGVILSAAERRKKITDGIPVKIKPDPGLLEVLVYLTEQPTPIVGNFDPEFLKLPEEVLVTVMRHHQKYFSVEDAHGKLAPQFVAVMNTASDPQGFVRQGNERVLKARFNDARFFWDFDQKKSLFARVDDLANVTFQAKLGSYLEKTQRNVTLTRELGGNENAQRAALLAKADLTTELVKEFTELQGQIGGLYARHQGEPEEVAQAIYDHYKPVSMEDTIPSTRIGQIVASADKLDTLRGCFGIKLIPSGSKDPFALRRAAQGLVRIILEGRQVSGDLRQLAAGNSTLYEFLLDRARYYFREIKGFAYDEVNAVFSAGFHELVDAHSRLEALRAVRPTPDFEPVAAGFKRINNILKQAQFTGGNPVNPELLEAGPETELYDAYKRVNQQIQNQPYRNALETIASLRPQVDHFFDKVLVNAKDESVRQNRLTLLHTLLAEFSGVADFSEIVTTSQEIKA